MQQNAEINNPALRDLGPIGPGGSEMWELVEPLHYHLPVNGNPDGGITIIVPAGYKTNFASTPRWLWPIFPPTGWYSRAAIIHDYLYTNRTACSRFLADAIFRDTMRELGTRFWKRIPMFYAVRAFGWLGWYRKEIRAFLFRMKVPVCIINKVCRDAKR